MHTINRGQFATIKARFAKLRSELDASKLAEFSDNLKFFIECAPFTANSDVVTRAELSELAKEVGNAQRACLNRGGETKEYSAYKASVARGEIDGHPGASEFKEFYAKMQKAFWENPALYHSMRVQLGGMPKGQLKGELPS
jgi:hypothetical protein